jgi:uncharacterized protein YcgI (DUF1989 family)
MTSKILEIEKRTAAAVELKQGMRLKIDQSLGTQLAVLVAFNLHDLSERFSQGKTRISLAFGPYKRADASAKVTYWIEKGDVLVSNRWKRMLTLIESSFQKHDIVFDPCDTWSNVNVFGQDKGYPGCRELHTDALKPWGVNDDEVQGGVNLFQNTVYGDDGIMVLPTSTEGGDFVIFEANMDVVVSVSACPFPLGESRPVRMEIS